MATIESYATAGGKRWRVRYRKPDRKQTDKRGFKTKRDAQLFAATVETSKAEGTYIDPQAGRVTVKELGTAWLARQSDWKPSYRYTMESTWNTHVLPKWGTWPVRDVTHSETEAWIAELGRSRSVAARCLTILSSILDDAVRDQLIRSNRVSGAALPAKNQKPRVYLTHQQVQAFAAAAGDNGLIIRTLAYTGLRWGELAGLHGADIDPHRLRVQVNRNAVQVGSRIAVGTPKTHELRGVPVPGFLMDELRWMTRREIVFPTPAGGYQRAPRASATKRSWWRNAVATADLPAVTPHDLRHTAASLAVQSGAHVKAIQRMLGHKSAAMTLDVYSDLFDSDLDAVAASLDAARAKALGVA